MRNVAILVLTALFGSALLAQAIPDPPSPPQADAADADPGIEVATVKQSRPDEVFSLVAGRGGVNVMTTTATSVRTLIQFANSVHPRQINRPAWIDSAHYDITAKSDQAGAPSISQMRIMMQKVLADRFQLVSDREKKELAVYAITIAKGGPKLAPHPGPPSNQPYFGFGLASISTRSR